MTKKFTQKMLDEEIEKCTQEMKKSTNETKEDKIGHHLFKMMEIVKRTHNNQIFIEAMMEVSKILTILRERKDD